MAFRLLVGGWRAGGKDSSAHNGPGRARARHVLFLTLDVRPADPLTGRAQGNAPAAPAQAHSRGRVTTITIRDTRRPCRHPSLRLHASMRPRDARACPWNATLSSVHARATATEAIARPSIAIGRAIDASERARHAFGRAMHVAMRASDAHAPSGDVRSHARYAATQAALTRLTAAAANATAVHATNVSRIAIARSTDVLCRSAGTTSPATGACPGRIDATAPASMFAAIARDAEELPATAAASTSGLRRSAETRGQQRHHEGSNRLPVRLGCPQDSTINTGNVPVRGLAKYPFGIWDVSRRGVNAQADRISPPNPPPTTF
jgi:hypothetical protein